MATRKLAKKVFVDPLVTFINDSKSIGIVLLIATAISIILANITSFSTSYISFFQWSIDGTDHHSFDWGIFHLPNYKYINPNAKNTIILLILFMSDIFFDEFVR